MPWLSRAFLLTLVAAAVAGSGCTRYGKPTPVTPTASPLTTIDVNPVSGSDTTGNGSSEKPFKTLTKALHVVKNSTLTNLNVVLAPGAYTTTSGETFPIVVPTGVTINGSGYGAGFAGGSFVNGIGEDVALEKLLHALPGTIFATLEIAGNVTSVAINNVYAGVSRFTESATASYATLDVLGAGSIGHSTLGAGTFFGTHPKRVGVVVPSGTFGCVGCAIGGGGAAILAYSLPGASAPVISLGGQPSQSTIGGGIGVATDGTASVTAAFQTFRSKTTGYQDSVVPLASPSSSVTLGSVDFGNGPNLSQGGNNFINVGTTGIWVTLPLAQVTAEGDTWTPNAQGADSHGQYQRQRIFNAGTNGKNVTVAARASGAGVIVGPIPPSTPTPAPTGSPTTSPSPT